MRIVLLLSICAPLAACSFSPPKPERQKAREALTHRCVAEQEDSCATYEMRACHELFVDGCLSGRTKRHECIARSGVACDQKSDWECPEGFDDGCDLEGEKRTPVHQCIATNGGVPCSEAISFECPTGFLDSCEAGK